MWKSKIQTDHKTKYLECTHNAPKKNWHQETLNYAKYFFKYSFIFFTQKCTCALTYIHAKIENVQMTQIDFMIGSEFFLQDSLLNVNNI